MFPKIGVPQNGWFILENPMNKWDDLGVNTIFLVQHPSMYTTSTGCVGFNNLVLGQ